MENLLLLIRWFLPFVLKLYCIAAYANLGNFGVKIIKGANAVLYRHTHPKHLSKLCSRQSTVDDATVAVGGLAHHQGLVVSEEAIQKLVAMGFERTQVEVAVAAADGDLNVAVEILMTQ
ncbi:RHOMBOID-like protein 15 [Actinidia rufa]|uniref:RHOMBOID-like protein 15 n=1 Tax=Actinidia rufa TaxID=165716 RepID=A0A7J0FV63_9ERIC|nr:RHOMBOID-like protein 15 [Actinidia rufa]GFZ02571.1 RHOMBOID-like protein 15 [Actinidia rufa]